MNVPTGAISGQSVVQPYSANQPSANLMGRMRVVPSAAAGPSSRSFSTSCMKTVNGVHEPSHPCP